MSALIFRFWYSAGNFREALAADTAHTEHTLLPKQTYWICGRTHVLSAEIHVQQLQQPAQTHRHTLPILCCWRPSSNLKLAVHPSLPRPPDGPYRITASPFLPIHAIVTSSPCASVSLRGSALLLHLSSWFWLEQSLASVSLILICFPCQRLSTSVRPSASSLVSSRGCCGVSPPAPSETGLGSGRLSAWLGASSRLPESLAGLAVPSGTINTR